jgi:hypothetical protein
MQFRQPPIGGIVYNTTMSRPDAALALALLYGLEGKREVRVASIAVTENSLGAAIFTDAVYRFYQLGPLANANRVLPVGLAADKPLPPDSPMVKAVLERVDEKGEPVYRTGLRRVSDSAEVTALMRNSLAYFHDGFVTVVLSAPATYLARILDYAGTRDLIKSKVRSLIVSECQQDVAAMRRVLAEWPTPIVFCGREVGEALLFPGSSIENDFAWTSAHPVVDFYRAYKAMPYDAPSQDLAAVLHAARPESGLFQLSEAGSIEVADDGGVQFKPDPAGRHKRMAVDPEKKDKILAALREVVTAKPVPPPPRRRFTPEEFEKLQKERDEEQKRREQQEKKIAVPPAKT